MASLRTLVVFSNALRSRYYTHATRKVISVSFFPSYVLDLHVKYTRKHLNEGELFKLDKTKFLLFAKLYGRYLDTYVISNKYFKIAAHLYRGKTIN